MNYVIIGNSAGAIGCVEGIRRIDAAGKITIISNEPHHTYGRPLISYLLQGKTDRDRMRYRPKDFYEMHRVDTILGKNVTKIFTGETKKVLLDRGEELFYDKLFVATGASASRFPINGLETVESLHTFMTLDDAEGLQKAVTPESHVFVLGAGLIGLKCAEGLTGFVKKITVCDLAPHVLSSILQEVPAKMIQEHLEKNGIEFELETSVQCFSGKEICLNNGKNLLADCVIFAAGVRPNTELIRAAGGLVNRGIVVDAFGRTSLSGIYAVGDCTEAEDAVTGERKIMALLPNAYIQGETAGIHAAGGEENYKSTPLIPENAIGFFGKHIISAGVYPGDANKIEEFSENGYRCFFYHPERRRLMGYIFIDDVRRAGIFTALIREKTELSQEKFDKFRKNSGLIALDPRTRAQILRKKEGVS